MSPRLVDDCRWAAERGSLWWRPAYGACQTHTHTHKQNNGHKRKMMERKKKKREAIKKEGEKKKSRGLKLLSRVMEVSVKGE